MRWIVAAMVLVSGCAASAVPDNDWQTIGNFQIQVRDQAPSLWSTALADCEAIPSARLTRQTEWQQVVASQYLGIDVPMQREWSYWNDDHDASYFDPDAAPEHRFVEDAPLPSENVRPYRCTRAVLDAGQ